MASCAPRKTGGPCGSFFFTITVTVSTRLADAFRDKFAEIEMGRAGISNSNEQYSMASRLLTAQLKAEVNMETIQSSNRPTACDTPLPDLELPMITTMVSCLRGEHRKLDILNLRLALGATGLARDPEALTAKQRAFEVWDEIRHVLWSHLQIENGLVLSWGNEHHAISGTMLDVLKAEFEQMRSAVAVLPGKSFSEETALGDATTVAQKLLAVTHALDSHLERYEREVLPSILRAAFHRPSKELNNAAIAIDGFW